MTDHISSAIGAGVSRSSPLVLEPKIAVIFAFPLGATVFHRNPTTGAVRKGVVAQQHYQSAWYNSKDQVAKFQYTLTFRDGTDPNVVPAKVNGHDLFADADRAFAS